jgi:hypothetical protein
MLIQQILDILEIQKVPANYNWNTNGVQIEKKSRCHNRDAGVHCQIQIIQLTQTAVLMESGGTVSLNKI